MDELAGGEFIDEELPPEGNSTDIATTDFAQILYNNLLGHGVLVTWRSINGSEESEPHDSIEVM